MSSVGLFFKVTVDVEEDSVESLGRDLAAFLRESWFNGEDVLDVEFTGYKGG